MFAAAGVSPPGSVAEETNEGRAGIEAREKQPRRQRFDEKRIACQ